MARHSVALLGETDSRRAFRFRALRRGLLRPPLRTRLAGLMAVAALVLLPPSLAAVR